jgi:hypothetical protein
MSESVSVLVALGAKGYEMLSRIVAQSARGWMWLT